VLEQFEASPSFSAYKEEIQNGNSVLIENANTTSKSLIAALTQKYSDKNIVFITTDKNNADIQEDLSFFNTTTHYYPSWETLPGEVIPPSPDIIGKRMEVLFDLTHTNKNVVVITTLQALLQKTISTKTLPKKVLKLKKGGIISFQSLPRILTDLGYVRNTIVSDKGEFAVRGGIIDIFDVAAYNPYRIEFFGDAIDNIRLFDPIGQKSIEKTSHATIYPSNELKILQQENNSSMLLDYIGDDTIIIFEDLLGLEDIYTAIQKLPASNNNPYLLNFDALWKSTSSTQKIYFSKDNIENLSPIKQGAGNSKFAKTVSFEMFQKQIECSRFFPSIENLPSYLSYHTEIDDKFLLSDYLHVFIDNNISNLIFINENEREETAIKEKIEDKIDINNKAISFAKGYLSSGFVITDLSLAVLPSCEFTKKHKIQRNKWRSTYHTPAAEFHHLQVGDIVVHFHSGIGKYLGIEKQKDHLGKANEFFVIEYEKGAKLFVPLSQAHLISKYIGSHEDMPLLSTLGSSKWTKTKLLAQKQIIGYASDLLHLYAERSLDKGHSYPDDSDEMQLLEQDFPYEETKDQHQSIIDIKKDMQSNKSMDRLICGDVGYGKTEVAMRAAAKAVFDGNKQVAILVPTTVLAMQHYETFIERMTNYPVNVSVVSRFHKASVNKKILEQVEKGNVDILIGTHRILSKDVSFKDLGLIIIDEEQRFGVRAKEHLKKLKKNVDSISLSATPIPRTLYLSLIKARDISVITTPPQDRLPIKTILSENEDEVIKNAILRELSRQGQTFFIHNRVESICQRSEHIQKLVPQARTAIVHGQMPSSSVDKIFHSFKEGEIDILFATTIVESGVDIPNANTIIIDRADTFGLADLYQLRGRVGRWNRSAYAYLITPKNRELSEISKKRLSVLLEAGGYGGGMKIAMRDLEIRGAGDILGVQQSGQVSSIGFHLYCKLLKKTITALQNKQSTSFIETKIELPFEAKLPEDYINATNLRMEIYYRLGEATSLTDVDTILEEMQDRFGKAPTPVLWLYHITRIRTFANYNNFTFIKLGKMSLIAEQQQGKKLTKKNMLFNKKITKPQELEIFLIETLNQNFKCSNTQKQS
jgi:transcription-repair coupling factor (superfamily II helicase)